MVDRSNQINLLFMTKGHKVHRYWR